MVHSVDNVVFNGREYSAVSPGFAFVSLPFAVAGFLLDGNKLNLWGNALLMDELFVSIASSVGVYFTYKICRLYARPLQSLITGLTIAFGTSVLPFSTMIFIHGASLMFSTASVYLILRYTKGINTKKRNIILSGLCLGGAMFVEYLAALFIVPLTAYLFLKGRSKAEILFFNAGFLIGPFAQLTYNYIAFSNALIFPEQLKGGPLSSQFELNNLALHVADYVISPYRGLLLFSPVVALGIFSLYRMLKSKKYRSDSILFVSLFASILVAYSMWRDWAGGLAYGPRFLILGMPYLIIPISILLNDTSSRMPRISLVTLFVASSFIEGTGAITTALSTAGGAFTSEFIFNLSWLFQTRLDSWWIVWFEVTNQLFIQLFEMLVFTAMWFVFSYLIWKERHTEVKAEEADCSRTRVN